MKYLLCLLFAISISAANAQTTDPCSSDAHKAFDFWQGEWTVHNADGSFAGRNSIKKIQKNCVLSENWTSAKGDFTGISLNFYHTEKKQWQQLWLDNSGGRLELYGNRVADQMIMRTDEAIDKDGKGYFHRITWTKRDDGSVRQLWETVSGEKVTIAFDGVYTNTN